ncbi:F-box-like protein [Thalictrum thalictroides]|uniref:F-box-like protein n=1 Tax=Thalictrum thalictroides TaxID=46969 RepID=A0A7J6W648_THATH|nr:F-box-like protein [Thalictrum thalictroides]
MENWEWNQSSLPYDIVFNILSSIQVEDVCSLGSCSKFWRQLCASDCLWISLYRERWPSLDFTKQSSMLMMNQKSEPQSSSIKGWRGIYVERHNEMSGKVTSVIKAINQFSTSRSLEVGDYQKAVADLHTMELGFKDVVMFLFSSKHNPLLNLVGLHYLVFWLGIPVDYVLEALSNSHISERQVCVKWWKLGRWMYGYRLRDESYSRKVSLADLALGKDEDVLGVLRRGAIYEVLRVQISIPDPTCIPWTSKSVYTLT